MPGLKVEDAILSIDSKLIEDSRDLARTIADLPAKSTVDVKVWRNKAEQTVKVKLGTYPNTAEAAEGTTEPEEPKDLGGNVDLKQLGLSVKPRPRQGRRRHLRRRSELGRRVEGHQGGRHRPQGRQRDGDLAAGRRQGRQEGAGRRARPPSCSTSSAAATRPC